MAAPSHSKGSRPVAVVRPEIQCKGSACNPLPLNPANRQECHQDKIAMDCIETLSCDGHGDGNEQEEKEARDLSEIFERTNISDYKPDEESENEICAEDYHCEPKYTEQSLESGNKGIQNTNGKDSPFLVVGINASPSPTLSNFNCHGNEDVENRRKEEILLQNDECLIAELGRKGIKNLARYLDPRHLIGNWMKVGRKFGLPKAILKGIEDKMEIHLTPAFKILEILPNYHQDLTVLDLVSKLESDDMRQGQIADEIRKSGKDLNEPFAMMDVEWKEKIAHSLMTQNAALGSWKDLGDLYKVPNLIINQIEEDARGERQNHSHTEGLILVLAGWQANLKMEDLAKVLEDLPRKDVAEEVRRMIENWNEYKIKK